MWLYLGPVATPHAPATARTIKEELPSRRAFSYATSMICSLVMAFLLPMTGSFHRVSQASPDRTPYDRQFRQLNKLVKRSG